ncbi:hypothetical protein MXB_2565 [Myxobolus squamalis]|nr:hypothetical protein MXB_2565 [Myxobolus squamalis]
MNSLFREDFNYIDDFDDKPIYEPDYIPYNIDKIFTSSANDKDPLILERIRSLWNQHLNGDTRIHEQEEPDEDIPLINDMMKNVDTHFELKSMRTPFELKAVDAHSELKAISTTLQLKTIDTHSELKAAEPVFDLKTRHTNFELKAVDTHSEGKSASSNSELKATDTNFQLKAADTCFQFKAQGTSFELKSTPIFVKKKVGKKNKIEKTISPSDLNQLSQRLYHILKLHPRGIRAKSLLKLYVKKFNQFPLKYYGFKSKIELIKMLNKKQIYCDFSKSQKNPMIFHIESYT